MINNKDVLSFFMMLITIVLGILGYYAFESFEKFEETKQSTPRISLVKQLDNIHDKIERERLYSAIYTGTGGEQGSDKLQNAREMVDQQLHNVISFSNEEAGYKVFVKHFEAIAENLKYVRSRVDILSMDYKNMLFDIYHHEVFNTLYDVLNDIRKQESAEDITRYLDTYIKYVKLKENVGLENATIFFYMGSSRIMTNEDLMTWDTLIFNDAIPTFDTLPNENLIDELNALMSNEQYALIGSEMRLNILYTSLSGNYLNYATTWFGEVEKKMKYIELAQSILYNAVEKDIGKYISQRKDVMQKYIIGVVISLLLLLVLFVVYYNVTRDKQLFEDTLKDIEAVLSLEKQQELQLLIDARDTNRIYSFLTQTIKEANETKDLFLANMSHEIRTPLNGIVGFTQLLKNKATTDEQKEFITVIENSSENLLNIVNDILDLSKIRADKVELESIEFDPVEKFESAIESYAAKAAEKHIDFNVYVDPSLPLLLLGDPTKISQVVVNLVSNAIKFTEEGGSVDVIIENLNIDDKYTSVQFSVKDTGIGISPKKQKTIFEAFSQADVSTSRKFGGTGLGLAISAKLVQLMGGQLKIKSEIKKGSTFYFILDLENDESKLQRVTSHLNGIQVGLVSETYKDAQKLPSNLDTYIKYIGAVPRYYTKDEVFKLKKNNIPDLLFIDQNDYKSKGVLKKFLSLETKIILMITTEEKASIEVFEEQIDRVLYKPVNLTKTIKALEVVNQSDSDTNDELEEKVTFTDLNVLVAEDNVINQKLIKRVLNDMGLVVTLANNGEEALSHRKDYQYDLIFMDIQMPIMGGIDGTKEILKFEHETKKPHIPIIALTANALAGDREKYLSIGMDNYMSKPIELQKLSLLLKEYFPEKAVLIESKNRRSESITDTGVNSMSTPKTHTTSQEKSEVLFYHPSSDITRLYQTFLEKLNLKTDVVTDTIEFVDMLEDSQYKYALYDAEGFLHMKCLIADLIKDYGTRPLCFKNSTIKEESVCCITLDDKDGIEEFKKKLGIET